MTESAGRAIVAARDARGGDAGARPVPPAPLAEQEHRDRRRLVRAAAGGGAPAPASSPPTCPPGWIPPAGSSRRAPDTSSAPTSSAATSTAWCCTARACRSWSGAAPCSSHARRHRDRARRRLLPPARLVVMRFMDGLMAFPAILLAIALMAARGPGVWNVIIALSLVYMPRTALLTRSTVLSLRELDYVQAALALGRSDLAVAFRHVAARTVWPRSSCRAPSSSPTPSSPRRSWAFSASACRPTCPRGGT